MSIVDCRVCGGRGFVAVDRRPIFPPSFDGHEAISEVECSECNGTGKIELRCSDINASFEIERLRSEIERLRSEVERIDRLNQKLLYDCAMLVEELRKVKEAKK